MTRVRATFLVTVEAEVDDYAYFVSYADAGVISPEKAQSWLSQNYFDRIDDGIEVGDRPESLTWSVDTVPAPIVGEVEALVHKDWVLADHIYGDEGFKEFARTLEREQALNEIGAIGQQQDAIEHARKVRDARHRAEARGYRDFL